MKRNLYSIVSLFIVSLVVAGAAWAAGTTDETTINKDSAGINSTANSTHGATVVSQRLEKEFNVTAEQIQGLRQKGMGYGEIAIVCSLAGKLPGGVTDANIAKITAMRQGPPVMGWGEIAKKLGTKLGPVVSQVSQFNKSTHHEVMHGEGHGAGHHDMSSHGGMNGTGGGMGNEGMSHGRGR